MANDVKGFPYVLEAVISGQRDMFGFWTREEAEARAQHILLNASDVIRPGDSLGIRETAGGAIQYLLVNGHIAVSEAAQDRVEGANADNALFTLVLFARLMRIAREQARRFMLTTTGTGWAASFSADQRKIVFTANHENLHETLKRLIDHEDAKGIYVPSPQRDLEEPTTRPSQERIADALTLLAVHSERRIWRDFDSTKSDVEHPMGEKLGELEGLMLLRLTEDSETVPSPEDMARAIAKRFGGA